MSKIYLIVRCIGPNASDLVLKMIDIDQSGSYCIRKINNSKDDQIIWFSTSRQDFGNSITEEFLLEKLQELGEGKVFTNPYSVKGWPDYISGTVKC